MRIFQSHAGSIEAVVVAGLTVLFIILSIPRWFD